VIGRRSARFAQTFACAVGAFACSSHGGTAAIPDSSSLLVATPSGLAVLAQAQSYAGLPGAITFGDPGGRSALYLQFSAEWRARGAPFRGFLALEPRAGEAPNSELVPLEAWRVRSAWVPGALHVWSDKPELAPPYVRTVIESSPVSTLRIDITELLRFAANNPELDQGIALISSSSAGQGASFATGISGGVAPRLEVYTR
jgi:hypothetical protein